MIREEPGHKSMKLTDKLYNRFNILTFLNNNGVQWAKDAIEPNDINWTPENYLACYNNPEA